MRNFIIKTSTLNGKIAIPPSKSQTLRAILFGTLAEGTTVVHNYLQSPDAVAMIQACRSLGANIETFHNYLEIEGVNGNIQGAHDVINAGNSGIVLRFIAAIAALGTQPVVITGDHSIRNQRPMKPLLDGLTQLNVSAISTRGNGFAPIIVQGPLAGGKTSLVGEDSQPVSALLIAASFAKNPTEIHVHNPGEKPWVALTLNWLDRLNIAYEKTGFEKYVVKGNSRIKGFTYKVPGDFSSAAYPIVAALITQSELIIENLDMHDAQGDKKFIAILQQMGACLELEKDFVRVKKGGKLKGIEVDINDCVDAISILSVVGCFAEGKTVIKNAAVARQKECDRITCTAQELKKMGADIVEHRDGLTIKQSRLKGTQVVSHQDQRMVMSLAVAGMGAEGTTTIRDIAWAEKTFPTFYRDFKALGAQIEEHA